jgi:hypothetical protein
MKRALYGACALLLTVLFGGAAHADLIQEKNKSTKPSAADTVKDNCPKIRKELERAIVYKADGYFVYVNPAAWRNLMIDERKSVGYLTATCYSQGTVRILDGRTGKLLARWGTNGYVTYE